MADYDYAGTLRRIADEIDEAGKFGSATVLRESADLIERLTPKPMTAEQAAKLLNDHEHQEIKSWHAWKTYGRTVVSAFDGRCNLDEFEAIAVAEKLEREQEAARA